MDGRRHHQEPSGPVALAAGPYGGVRPLHGGIGAGGRSERSAAGRRGTRAAGLAPPRPKQRRRRCRGRARRTAARRSPSCPASSARPAPQRAGDRRRSSRHIGDTHRQAGLLKMRGGAGGRRRTGKAPSLPTSRTPAPCRSPPPRHAAAGRNSPPTTSSAWPNVWPRLSSARRPALVSSSATMSAFAQAALLDRMQASRRVALEYPCIMRFQPVEEGGVAQKAVFRNFSIAGAQLARVQRIEHIGVDQHEARLMEGADQVLAVPGVDAGFAADGGVRPGRAASWGFAPGARRVSGCWRRSPRGRRSRRRRAR